MICSTQLTKEKITSGLRDVFLLLSLPEKVHVVKEAKCRQKTNAVPELRMTWKLKSTGLRCEIYNWQLHKSIQHENGNKRYQGKHHCSKLWKGKTSTKRGVDETKNFWLYFDFSHPPQGSLKLLAGCLITLWSTALPRVGKQQATAAKKVIEEVPKTR